MNVLVAGTQPQATDKSLISLVNEFIYTSCPFLSSTANILAWFRRYVYEHFHLNFRNSNVPMEVNGIMVLGGLQVLPVQRLSLPNVTLAMDNYKYRAKITWVHTKKQELWGVVVKPASVV
jgi:hypothetical protein